jgi:acetyl esterase/lipase
VLSLLGENLCFNSSDTDKVRMTPSGDTGIVQVPVTVIFKSIQALNLCVDVYPPRLSTCNSVVPEGDVPAVPVILYFHGGGMTVGDRNSWFPTWLYRTSA